MFAGLEEVPRSWLSAIESRLDLLCQLKSGPSERLSEAMRYSLLSSGKRLRPILALASAEAVGGDPFSAIDAGCAIEMVHAFSLIHDDLPAIDNDDLRRGRPTLHKAFDEMTAILAGDALFALAYETLSSIKAEPARVTQSVLLLSQAVGRDGLVGGEYVDVVMEGEAASTEAIDYIHPRKTGALFAATCAMGGLLGGGTNLQVTALKAYGADLGLAFQIADDILNETSTEEQLGKPVGNDRHAGKQTFPAVYGVDRSEELAKDAISRAIGALQSQGIESPPLFQIAQFAVSRKH